MQQTVNKLFTGSSPWNSVGWWWTEPGLEIETPAMHFYSEKLDAEICKLKAENNKDLWPQNSTYRFGKQTWGQGKVHEECFLPIEQAYFRTAKAQLENLKSDDKQNVEDLAQALAGEDGTKIQETLQKYLHKPEVLDNLIDAFNARFDEIGGNKNLEYGFVSWTDRDVANRALVIYLDGHDEPSVFFTNDSNSRANLKPA